MVGRVDREAGRRRRGPETCPAAGLDHAGAGADDQSAAGRQADPLRFRAGHARDLAVRRRALLVVAALDRKPRVGSWCIPRGRSRCVAGRHSRLSFWGKAVHQPTSPSRCRGSEPDHGWLTRPDCG